MRAQRAGDVQRRALQAEAARGGFVPAHVVVRRQLVVERIVVEVAFDPPAAEPRREFHRASVAGVEAGRRIAPRRQRELQGAQRRRQRLESSVRARIGQRARLGRPRRQRFQRRTQGAHRLLQVPCRRLQCGQRTRHALALRERVARELDQRPRADALAEELRGEFRQLVRLVDDEGLCAGQDFAESFLLQREVGEQQVVVHDHDVGGLGPLPRLHHEAVVPVRAFAAEAVVGGARDQRQQRRVVGQRLEFGEVAHARAPAPGDDALEQRGLRAGQDLRIALRLFDAMAAEVIGPPLQQRALEADAERVAHPRQVAMVELVLQRARAGGEDRLHPRQQRGHQVGIGLAGAGAGFGEQHLAPLERVRDRFGQVELRIARPELRHRTRERAAFGQCLDRLFRQPSRRTCRCVHRDQGVGGGSCAGGCCGGGGGTRLAGSSRPKISRKPSRTAWPRPCVAFGSSGSIASPGGAYTQGW